MGFCKCRVVTSLFCFDHRKNVCENCLLTDHQTCIVKTYLQWLQDSDFSSNCTICKQGLKKEGERTVRLPCMDVFHASCLNDYFTNVSRDYSCPICQEGLVGADGRVSQGPLGSAMVQQLAPSYEWARSLFQQQQQGGHQAAGTGGGGGDVVLTINRSSESSQPASLPAETTKLLSDDEDKYGRGKKSLLRYFKSLGLPLLLLVLVLLVIVFLIWPAGTSTTATAEESIRKPSWKKPNSKSKKQPSTTTDTADDHGDDSDAPVDRSTRSRESRGRKQHGSSSHEGLPNVNDVFEKMKAHIRSRDPPPQ